MHDALGLFHCLPLAQVGMWDGQWAVVALVV